MLTKAIKRYKLHGYSSAKEDLAFWLRKPAEERVATVDYLRKQYHGSAARLQRSARVIQQTSPT
jgi:hypothetical protein